MAMHPATTVLSTARTIADALGLVLNSSQLLELAHKITLANRAYSLGKMDDYTNQLLGVRELLQRR